MRLNTHATGADPELVCFTVENVKEVHSVEITCQTLGRSLMVLDDELDGLINALIAMRDVIIPQAKENK